MLAAVLWTAAAIFGIIRRPSFSARDSRLANARCQHEHEWFFANHRLAIGWLLVGWVGVQGLMLAVKAALSRKRRKREYAEERADFCRRVEAAARAARASKAIADWSGWRPFRVAAIVDEAHDVKSFYFTPEDGQPLAPFAPGQYLTFRLPRAGRRYAVGAMLLAFGSAAAGLLSGDDQADCRAAERPEMPPGRGSNYFHDSVHVGDVLDVRAPAGTFLLDPLATEPIVLIGAGIGVTPLVSMLEAIVQTGQKREVYVLFGFRNGGEHPFKERLAAIAAENPQIRLHVSYSAPAEADVLYRDYNHRGRVTLERVRQVLPSNNFRFYVCGPGPLMESLVPALWEWGVPESHVHFEAFGPASVRSASHKRGNESAVRSAVRTERSHGDVGRLVRVAAGVWRGGGRDDALGLPGRKLRRVHDGDSQRRRSRPSSSRAFRCRRVIA